MSEVETHAPSNSVTSFDDLAASRRHWIDTVLRPWCRQATRKQLCQANVEWLDIAGRVDVAATLWTWTWERFPVLTHEDLSGVNETYSVEVRLRNGDVYVGFPDSRQSTEGHLVLIGADETTGASIDFGPLSVDDIESVTRTVDRP